MDLGFAGAVIALLFLFFGIFAGVGAGDILAKRCVTRGEYIRMNVVVLAAGALLTAVVCLPWKKADTAFCVNKDHVRRAKDPEAAEAARRARRDGAPEPELMSTMAAGKDAKKGR